MVNPLVQQYTKHPGPVTHRGHTLHLAPFRGQRIGYFATDLQVTETGSILGFITTYSDTLIAAGPAVGWSQQLPDLVGTLPQALDAILNLHTLTNSQPNQQGPATP